jgi:hypothetical protein
VLKAASSLRSAVSGVDIKELARHNDYLCVKGALKEVHAVVERWWEL